MAPKKFKNKIPTLEERLIREIKHWMEWETVAAKDPTIKTARSVVLSPVTPSRRAINNALVVLEDCKKNLKELREQLYPQDQP